MEVPRKFFPAGQRGAEGPEVAEPDHEPAAGDLGDGVRCDAEAGAGEGDSSSGEETRSESALVPGDEVRVTMRAKAADGGVLEERPPMDYEVGSNDLGPISREAERLVTSMKLGDEATVNYGEPAADGATLAMRLDKVYTRDVSFTKDRAVLKKRLHAGTGSRPKDGAALKLRVEAATDGAEPLAGFVPDVLDFVLGNGSVCDALEAAAATMRKGERALLKARAPRMTVGDTIRVLRSEQGAEGRVAQIIEDDGSDQPYACEGDGVSGWFEAGAVTRAEVRAPTVIAEPRVGLADAATDRVVLTVELLDFAEAEEGGPTRMAAAKAAALLEFALGRKEVGTALFKSGRLRLALQRYKGVVTLLGDLSLFSEESRLKAAELKRACELNQAMCHLKLEEFSCAKLACDSVLQEDASNVKALYRRAQAGLGLELFADSIHDCKSIIAGDASNKEARLLLKQAQEGHRKAQGLYGNMRNVFG